MEQCPRERPLRRACAVIAMSIVVTFSAASCLPVREDGLCDFDRLAPEHGTPAPSFELRTLGGGTRSLAQLTKDRPLVLYLGSLSCPVFRERCDNFAALWDEYSDRVNFAMHYPRDAHPAAPTRPSATGEWIGGRIVERQGWGVPESLPEILDGLLTKNATK